MKKFVWLLLLLPILSLFAPAQATYNFNIGGLGYSSGASVPASCPQDGYKFWLNSGSINWYTCKAGTWTADASGAAGLADPGANGIVKRTALNTTAVAVSADVIALWTGTCNSGTVLNGAGACTAAGAGTVTSSGPPTANQVPIFSNATNLTGLTLSAGQFEVGTGTTPTSANPGCLDARAYMATPYNATPESEDMGLVFKNAIAAAGAAARTGTFCIDASNITPSGGWTGTGNTNYLFANTNPYLGVTPNQGIDIRFPNGPIITSVQWTTPQSGIKWYGSPHTGTLGGSSGSELVACNVATNNPLTSGGCGPNHYPQFMVGGVVANICVGTAGACAQAANTALVTMNSAADCNFNANQIVMLNANLGANGQSLNGFALTVSTGCGGGTTFVASGGGYAHAAFTTEANTGYAALTCANGGTNCFPVSGQFTTIPTIYSTGQIAITANATSVTGTGTTWTSAMVGSVLGSACPSNSCVIPMTTSNGPTWARVIAVPNATTLTLETAWSGGTVVNGSGTPNYLLIEPNVPVLVCDTCEGKSLNLNAFGHVIDGVSFDMNGILEGVAYLDNQAQERTTLNNSQIQMNGQQNRINATGGACAVWGSGYITAGHFNVVGPNECDLATNAGHLGWIGGTTPWQIDGWVIEGYNYIAQSSNAGAEYFNLGTVQGASGGFYDATWIDGSFGIGVQMSQHTEHFVHDAMHVGQNNATYGNMILNPNANSPLTGSCINGTNNGFACSGNGNCTGGGTCAQGVADVEFDTHAFGNQVWDVEDSWLGCFVRDDVLSTPCLKTASNASFSSRMFVGYSQAQATGGLYLGGGSTHVAGTVEAWLSSTNVIDTGISRDAADTIDLGNGTAGDKSATVNLATLNATSVANIGSTPPTCGTGVTGAWCLGSASTAITPASGMLGCQADSVTNVLQCSFNGLALAPLFPSQGTNVQSGAGYTVVLTDYGKIISVSNASAQTVTLPSTAPFKGWKVDIENTGTGTWTVSRNGLNIDGGTTNPTLATNQGLSVFSDGSNYFTQRGVGGAGGGGASGAYTIGAAKTTSYTTVSGDFSSSSTPASIIHYSCTTANTTCTHTLPNAVTASGTYQFVRNDCSSTNALFVTPANALTLDNIATANAQIILEPCSKPLKIISDGTNWQSDLGQSNTSAKGGMLFPLVYATASLTAGLFTTAANTPFAVQFELTRPIKVTNITFTVQTGVAGCVVDFAIADLSGNILTHISGGAGASCVSATGVKSNASTILTLAPGVYYAAGCTSTITTVLFDAIPMPHSIFNYQEVANTGVAGTTANACTAGVFTAATLGAVTNSAAPADIPTFWVSP